MVYFKFLFSKDLVDEITSQKAITFYKLFYPVSGDEKFCYISIADNQFEAFLKAFITEQNPLDDWLLNENSKEWPEHPSNFSNNNRRGFNFHFFETGSD